MKIQLMLGLAIFFFGIHQLTAQEENTLKGKIETEYPIDFQVNIINVNRHTGSISQPDGRFSIKAETGDEVLFSAMGYMPYTLEVTEENLKQEDLVIHLRVATNVLGEVKLSSSGLTGDIRKDAAGTYFFDQSITGIPLDPRPKLTQAERRYFTATTSSGGLIPLDPIINAISGRLKMLKLHLNYEREEKKIDWILDRFDLDFLTEETGIPEDEINLFLYYCLAFDEIDGLLKPDKSLELIDFLKEKSERYLQNKETTAHLDDRETTENPHAVDNQ